MSDDFLRSDWPRRSTMTDADDPHPWLAETAQLDLNEPKLRITAQKLTQSVQTLAGRAAAIHGFVRRLPFAACTDATDCTAGDVLRRRRGDCHTKGLLFVALCRAAGLPARLSFVDVRARFLNGILDEGPDVMPHAVGEVLLQGRWLRTDGYVVDPILFAQAKRLMRDTGADAGWGIVADAQGTWDAAGDGLQQFRGADVVRWHAPVHDPAEFYARTVQGTQGWTAHLKYLLGAHLVNRRVDALRRIPG